MNTVTPATFPRERLQMIAERERTHFWHAPRHRLLLDTIADYKRPYQSPLLDVGCGTGALVEALAERGFDAFGLDPWASACQLDATRFRTGQVESIPWPDRSFSMVCAFDVLEHADDGRALQELSRVLAPGGRLFLSVPAYDWLWSTRDDLAGHRRRYTRALLRERLVQAGFSVERIFGYQFFLLALFAASRLWSRARGRTDTSSEDRPGPGLNFVLRMVNALEVAIGRRLLRPPTGSSLLLIATKPAEGRP
jgi:SAM-dependent methyltransferase